MGTMKIGMIGLDTSHCGMFTKMLNCKDDPFHVAGGEVVAAYPGGTQEFSASRDRVEGFTKALRDEHGLTICDSIEEVGKQVDAFLLESVDGRQHLEQFRILATFGKAVFIDKPLACSYEEAREIASLAESSGIPIMSSSSIRYNVAIAGLVAEDAEIHSCEAFGPASILDDYPGYFWYGVHSAEVLFSKMGTGCKTVQVIHGDNLDLLVGLWEDGRVGTVRGTRFGQNEFGCTVFCSEGIKHTIAASEPPGYTSLLEKVIPFLQTGKSPIDIAESLEIMAFLDAAGQSLENGGKVVPLPR